MWQRYLKICPVYVFAVRKENANMVFIRKQINVAMFLLHAIPINENTMVSLGRELLGCFIFKLKFKFYLNRLLSFLVIFVVVWFCFFLNKLCSPHLL